MSASNLENLLGRLETVTTRLESMAHTKSGSPVAGNERPSPMVEEYDNIINNSGKNFLSLSQKIGGDVAQQVAHVKTLFDAEHDFLVKVSRCKTPDQSTLNNLLLPIANQITAVQEFREKHRSSPLFNHLSAISESVPAFGWITVAPTPAPYLKEMSDAGQFFTNRVLKDFKEKDPTHVAWVKSWLELLTELHSYVKKFHTTGIQWNKQGVDVGSSGPATRVPGPPSGGPAPPPPPGPPPPPVAMEGTDAHSTSDNRSGLFSQINQGADITKSLKKVADDQKTHKNPALRTQEPNHGAKPMHGAKPTVAAKPGSHAPKVEQKKPPKLELEGKKWVVEHFSNNHTVTIDDTEMKQTVYIFKCDNSTITIKGKVNAITLDSCKKVGVVFDEAISAIDFVNCQSVKTQVLAKVPIVNIDKTDGCMIYLSKDSLKTQIVAAKSSEMNVLLPDDINGFKEFAIPEQFRTYWDGNKLVTEMTDVKVG